MISQQFSVYVPIFFFGCFPCWWTVETENSKGFLSLASTKAQRERWHFANWRPWASRDEHPILWQVVGGLLVLVYLVLLWCYITYIYLFVTVSDVRQCLWRRMFTIYYGFTTYALISECFQLTFDTPRNLPKYPKWLCRLGMIGAWWCFWSGPGKGALINLESKS